MSTDLMHRLAAMQQFDGSYNLDPSLCSILNVNYSLVNQEISVQQWNSKAFAVTLVLAFFRDKLSSLQEDWELIADKSRLFLLDNAASKADVMFESAVKFVGGS